MITFFKSTAFILGGIFLAVLLLAALIIGGAAFEADLRRWKIKRKNKSENKP